MFNSVYHYLLVLFYLGFAIFNCVYQCLSNVYWFSPMFTHVCTSLPTFASVTYASLYLLVINDVYSCLITYSTNVYSVYLCLLLFTYVYLCLPMFITVHSCLPMFTYVFSYLPMFTLTFIPMFITLHSCLPMFIFAW